MEYLISESNHFPAKVTSFSAISHVIDSIKTRLNEEQQKMFRSSCFGMMLDINYLTCSGQLLHQLLLRQVPSPEYGKSLYFKFSGKEAKFSIEDFALITGLCCTSPVPTVSTMVDTSHHRLKSRYFEEKEGRGRCKGTGISRGQLEDTFEKCEFINDTDAVKLALVYFVESVLMSKQRRNYINLEWLQLVDNLDAFNKFPWGTICYERTANSLAAAMVGRAEKFMNKTNKKETYSLVGFPIVLQIWAYEVVPRIGQKYATKSGNLQPRILNWSSTSTPESNELVAEIFNQENLEVHQSMVAIETEKERDYYNSLGSLRKRKRMDEKRDVKRTKRNTDMKRREKRGNKEDRKNEEEGGGGDEEDEDEIRVEMRTKAMNDLKNQKNKEKNEKKKKDISSEDEEHQKRVERQSSFAGMSTEDDTADPIQHKKLKKRLDDVDRLLVEQLDQHITLKKMKSMTLTSIIDMIPLWCELFNEVTVKPDKYLRSLRMLNNGVLDEVELFREAIKYMKPDVRCYWMNSFT